MSNLRAWRLEQNPRVSQASLAEKLNTTQSHISEIEREEDRVSLEVAGKVFAVTGVRIGKMRDATDQQAAAVAQVAAQ